MVNRKDLRKLNEYSEDLISAVSELEDLHEQSQKDGITVDDDAYAEAQKEVQNSVSNLVNYTDNIVDRTDRLEDEDGNVLVELPGPCLPRDGHPTTKPKKIREADSDGDSDDT